MNDPSSKMYCESKESISAAIGVGEIVKPKFTCASCVHKKSVANRTHSGVKIPGESGKCTRQGGFCPERKAGMDKKADSTAAYAALLKSMPCNRLTENTTELVDSVSAATPAEEIINIRLDRIVLPSPAINIRCGDECSNTFGAHADVNQEALSGLVDSIRAHGVQVPIIVRPATLLGGGEWYELVAGSRRLRAKGILAGETGDSDATIPAIVRNLTNEQAREISIIENLQRENLTDMEEARAFAALLKAKGPEAAGELSLRLGVSPQYIRRRAKAAELPEDVLSAWSDGVMSWGHVELFLGIDPDLVAAALKWILERHASKWDSPVSVSELREWIDGRGYPHGKAKFDLAQCVTCPDNSAIQRTLFGIGDSDAVCRNLGCFMAKQRDWINSNWEDVRKQWRIYTGIDREHWVFVNSMGEIACQPERTSSFVYALTERCHGCIDLYAPICIDATPRSCYLCLGDKDACEKASKKDDRGKAVSIPENGSKFRVAWHGEHFRQAFLQERLPWVMRTLDSKEKALHLTLIAYLQSAASSELYGWFFKAYGSTDGCRDKRRDKLRDVIAVVKGLSDKTTLEALYQASMRSIMRDKFNPPQRLAIAEYIGVDLAAEWRLTEEYLAKKTTAEIRAIGEKFQLWDRPEVLARCPSRNYQTAKKGQLIDALLKSDTDLAGVVPDEILNGPDVTQDFIYVSPQGEDRGSGERPDEGDPEIDPDIGEK